MIKRIFKWIVEAVFPSNIYCICCGAMIDDDRAYSLCDTCMQKIHWINERSCRRCGKALADTYVGEICYNCMAREHKFKRGFSCMTYGLFERQMILDFKYNGKGYMGMKFGDILADRIALEDLPIDVIVPVPVHKEREKQRGYNQTAIMARRMGGILGITVKEHGCKRVKKTKLLRSMNPFDRDIAMNGAFQVPENQKIHIEHKIILLIDDIITTGATADACTQALLDAGASEVYLLTLASGGNRRPFDIDN